MDYSTLPPEFGADDDYWTKFNDLANDCYQGGTNRSKANLDTLLIFAGLFAGVNTTFITLSLDLLRPSSSDQTNNLLRLLLLSQSVDEATIHSASKPWAVEGAAIPTGYCFAISLAITLLAAFGALVGKQWIGSYQRPSSSSRSEELGIIRLKRLEATKTYRFTLVLATVSILIEFAVAIFLLGFIGYIWDINCGIAYVVIGIIAVGGIAYIATVLLAVYDKYCPFQTSFSEALRESLRETRKAYATLLGAIWPFFLPMYKTMHTIIGGLTRTRPDEEMEIGTIVWSGRASEPVEPQESIGNLYALSLRWILRTSTDDATLLSAAHNIPLLRHSDLYHSNFINPEGHPNCFEYEKLLSLLRHSLTRSKNSSTPSQDTLVYGRAVFHCLIQSSQAGVGFGPLFSRLEKSIPYGRRSTKGELRVLLACIQNDPDYWKHVEDVGDLEIDLSVLPIYIASISITCPPQYSGRWISLILEKWFRASVVIPQATGPSSEELITTASHARSPSLALSQSTITPRVLGLAAILLVRGRFLQDENIYEALTEALRPFVWKQYEGDTGVYHRILEALEAYPGIDCTLKLNPSPGPEGDNTSPGIEFAWLPKRIPIAEENEAYAAFIKGVAHSIDMLFDGTDDYQLPFHRNNRIQHRSNLRGHLGQNIRTAMQNILPSVLSQDLSTEYCRSLVEETISFIGKATNKEMWNLTSDGLPPDLIWHAASQIQKGSIAMDGILTLMKDATSEGDLFYDDLFRQHPKAASMLMESLYDERPEVRGISSELFQKNGHLWFDITEEGNRDLHLFDDRGLSDALTKHIKMRKLGDDPYLIMDIVDIVRRRGKLTERLLDGLYEVVVGPEMDAGMDKKEVLETSLEIWALVVEQLSDVSQMRWQSANMMMALNEYIKNLKDEYEVADWNRKQALQFPRWLEKYHQRVDKNKDSSTMYWFETYHQYRELISLSPSIRI